MERVSRDLPESPARRVGRIARVGARYGFGFVFRSRLLPGRRREEPGRVGTRLRFSLEELGPTFAELGRFLSIRRDLIPSDVAAELGRTRVAAKPVRFAEVRAYVERSLATRWSDCSSSSMRSRSGLVRLPSRTGPGCQEGVLRSWSSTARVYAGTSWRCGRSPT